MNLGLPVSPKTFARVLFWIVAWPFLAVVGACIVGGAVLGAARKLVRATRVRRDALRCPRGHAVDVIGRWLCENCGSEFLGWVGACEVCGDESADWTPCRCGLAVPLPWRGHR